MDKEATTANAAASDQIGTILRDLDSQELAWRAKRGSQAAFTELVRRYAPKLQTFLRHRIRCHHEVEDLVQDTFIKAYRNLGRYDDSWRFSTWLFTIGGRLAASRRRKREPQPADPDSCSPACDDEVIDRQEQEQSLWATVAELPDSQRDALRLRYARDMSIKEIATAMGKSQVCVKVLLYRARVALANRLKDRPEVTGDM